MLLSELLPKQYLYDHINRNKEEKATILFKNVREVASAEIL